MTRTGLVLLLPLALPGCFLPGFEKVEGEKGGGGTNVTCESASFEQPGQGGGDGADPVDFFAALHAINFGETTLATRPGFDLDGACTCCEGCDEPGSCGPPAGAEGNECDQVDGVSNAGRDNNAAKFFAGLTTGGLDATSDSLTTAAETGAWSVLFRVFEYNGEVNDSDVSVAIYTTTGAQLPPQWDGADVYHIRSDSVVDLDPLRPRVTRNDAYVVDGVLVAVFQDPSPLILRLQNGFFFELSYAVLRARIEQVPNGFALREGVIGGIWSMPNVFQALASMRSVNGDALVCTGTMLYDDAIKGPLCGLRDSSLAAAPACQAISVGVSFSADPILTPPMVDDVVLPFTPCAAGTDPSGDSCD